MVTSVCTLVVVALVSFADKTTIVWYVAKSQFHKHIHTMHNRQYPEGQAHPCALHACTEARPSALHAFILRPNNPNNALSATAAQYAGPQTNRLTVKVAVKAAKAASPQLAVSCSTEHDQNLRRRSVCARRPPLAGRPRIKWRRFMFAVMNFHDLPQRYSAGEKRSLDVRAHL